MAKSLFIEWLEKNMRPVVGALNNEFINGRKVGPKYIAHRFLSEEWTPSLTWNTTNVSRSIVAADVVSLDSSIPLKRRPSLRTESGDIAKIGTKRVMRESDLTRLDFLRNNGHADLDETLGNNLKFCVEGIEATVESMFLTALSTGVLLLENANGQNGVRANFGYKAENKFAATKAAWSNAQTADPIADLYQLVDKANEDGTSIVRFFISKKYLNYLRATDTAKMLYANYSGIVFANASNIGSVNQTQMLEALRQEFGAEFEVVDQKIRVEDAAGNHTSRTPWAEANIIGVTTDTVGRIVYGTLAEKNHPSEGVIYAENGNYTLVSQWSETDPKVENVKAEALLLTVIDNADEVYMLVADRTQFLAVSETELTYPKSGATRGIKFSADTQVTATTTANWITTIVDSDNSVVKITAIANTGDARTATITLTDGDGNTATINVSQNAGA